jgi:hypothetical protein
MTLELLCLEAAFPKTAFEGCGQAEKSVGVV